MKRFLPATALFFLIGLAACMARNETKSGRNFVAQNVDLPYRFVMDKFEVVVSSPEFTTSVAAWNSSEAGRLDDDERWMAVYMTIRETEGRERQFPWTTMVRLRTALGFIVDAQHALRASGGEARPQLGFPANGHEDMRLFFKVKRGDFPVDLLFGDGAFISFGE